MIEFSSSDQRLAGNDLHVRNAFMWVKIDRHTNRRNDKDVKNDRSITLWVFRMIEPYQRQNQSNHRLLDKVSTNTLV